MNWSYHSRFFSLDLLLLGRHILVVNIVPATQKAFHSFFLEEKCFILYNMYSCRYMYQSINQALFTHSIPSLQNALPESCVLNYNTYI